jgi:hypothetical protein
MGSLQQIGPAGKEDRRHGPRGPSTLGAAVLIEEHRYVQEFGSRTT